MLRKGSATLLACFLFLIGFAQVDQAFDSLSKKFAFRDSLYASSQLYLHTDKTIYTGNENIWIAAYLLKGIGDFKNYHTLYAVLSHRITHEVIASNQFVMVDGIAAGNIFIADSFPPGDYNLIAYTNSLNKEYRPGLFQQQVTIRYGGGNPYRVELEGGTPSADSIRFIAHVTNKAMLNAAGAAFTYRLYGDDKEIRRGSAVVSPFGEVPLVIPNDPSLKKIEMRADIQKEKTSFAMRMPLSFLNRDIVIRWYPESGNWINGFQTRTAFEIRDRAGKPVAISGKILEDGRPIASFKSSVTGTGLIDLIPLSGKTYSLLPDDKDLRIVSCSFPEVKESGATLQVKEAVARDTLFVRLHTSSAGENMYLLVHNYRQIFDFMQLSMPKATALLKVPLQSMENGLTTITLFDPALHPLAERTFFRGYDSLPLISITTDSSAYHRRSKADVQINMKDAKGEPLSGSISLAAVLTKSVDTAKFQDVLPYRLFHDYIDMGIVPPLAMYGVGSKEELEMLLLTRCWTRYKDPAPDSAIRELAEDKRLMISGTVKTAARRLKGKPVELTVLTGSGLNTAATDSSGHFVLAPEITALESHEKLHLIVNEKNKEEYKIEMDHDADSLNKGLAGLYYPEAQGIKVMMPEMDESLAQVKTLTGVVVKSKASSWGGQPKEYTSFTCNDYVCSYNILNCPNHKTGSPAVEGEVYNYRGSTVVYHCPGRNAYGVQKELLVKIKGRYYSKEFYVADYAKFNPPDPEKYSTVFWSPQILVNEGKASLSFYTNDLPGIFTIIVEGISTAGPVSAHQTIRVVE